MKLFVYLAAFAALVAVVSTQGSTVSCSDRTDIVLVLDGSESISDQDFEIMKNASRSFAEEAFRRINQLRIGAVIFGTDANTFLQLTNARNTAIQALNSIGRPDRASTNTHEGIKAARNILTDPTSNRIMIVITDGNSNNPTTTEMEADSAKSDGIIIFTVGVFKYFNSLGNSGIIQEFRNEFNAELRTIASNPTQVVAIEDFSTLAIEITNLLDDVCIIAVTFLTRLFDRTAILGETVTLIARTSGTSTASFSWTKNGVAINNGLRVFYDSFNGEYRLVITNVEASDAGTYTLNIGGATTSSVLTVQSVSGWGEWTEIFGQPCSATCGSGVRPVTYVRTCLSLPVDCSGEDIKVETKECTNDPCPGTGAFFTVALNDVMVDVGQSFVITGTLSEVVSANYQWRRNGVQLTQDGRVSFNVVGSIYTLSINNAQASDAGRYTLTVGTQSSSADVTVNRRDFAVNLNNDTVSTGTTITLVGTLDNAVTDNFRWSRNGVQLSQGGRISFSVVGSTYTLTITGARQEDAGEYTLQVGSRTSTGFVNVLTNVGVCVSNMDVMLAIDGSSSIGRAAFGDTIIPALQGFVSGYFQSKTDRRLGYVLYSTEVRSSVPLSSDVTAINQALSTEVLPNGNTYTDKALAEILAQFQASSRTEANKFAIVITDGKSDDGQATQEQGRLLKELNTTIIVVGVTDAVNRSELLALSSGPQYVQAAQAIADLADTLNLLIQCDPTWAEWRFDSLTTCNASCDGGYRVRTFIRDCQNASPTTTCTGSRTREVNEPCNTQACPEWSAWGADGVSGCSVSCGNGNRIRRYIRVCLNQTPTNNCEGTNSKQESETCFEGNCPAWSEWIQPGVAGGCSVSCGGGTRTRTYSRTCLNGGSLSDCGIQSTKSEQENCNEVACPVVWSAWSEVRGDCSELCGTTGTRTLTRSRQCLSGNCQDETVTTTEACNRRNCLIFSNLVDVTVNEGRAQTFLTAQVVAAGVTGGQWFKGGVIVNDARFFPTSQGVDRSLIISNVEMGDAGTYTYVRGNEVTQVRLVVVPIPVVWSEWNVVRGDCSELCGTTGTQTVTRSRQCLSGNCQDETVTATESCNSISCLSSRNLVDITVTEGTSASIVAQVIAAGVTGGQWVKDGQVVSGSRFTISSQGTNRILSINNIQMGDAGTYRFVLGNELTEVRLVVIPLEPTWGAWEVTTIGACDVSCGTGNRLQIRNRVCQEGNCEGPTEESSLIPCTLPSCNVCQNDLEVMLAIDSSSSIGRDSFNNDLIPAIKNFTLDFLDGRTDRKLGFVVYSTSINSEVPLSNNANTITSALDRLGLPNGDTSTDLALGSIIDTFNSSPASTNKIAIVITDGESSNPFETTRQGNILKGLGVTIVAVGIGAESTSNFASELRNLASSTDLVFLPENFGTLSPVLLQIAPDCPVASWSAWVETSVSGCTVSCGGGTRTRAFTRTCTNTSTSNTCVGSNTKTETETCNNTPCAAIWGAWEVTSTGSCDVTCGTGNRLQNRTRVCQEGSCQGPTEESTLISCTLPSCNVCQNDLEVMLAIDSSSSIGRDSFNNDLIPAIKNFTLNFLDGRTDRKLGFVVYSTSINSEVPLSNNANTITSALDRLGLPNGDTSTDLALGSIIDTFNSSPASTNKIAIVITDGESSNPFETTRQGNILKGLGVTIVAVGIGAESTSNFASELRNLASSTDLVFLPENFGILSPVLLQIAPDCPVASWSEWVETSVSGCTVTCGGGSRTRAFTRTCTVTATSTTCVGSNTRSETEICNTSPCAGADISYRWLEWVEIRTECSVTCGGGTFRITRTRSCEDPTNSCQGPSTETISEACNTKPCSASFGQWTEWGLWNPSCPTCGPVTIVQVRTRVCRQLPGALPCPGDSRQNRSLICSVDSCQGTWNTWGSWSTPTCPSCGDNVVRTVTRTRTCSQLAGQDPCEGTNTDFQTVTCDIERCSGTWNTWGSWSTPTCPSCGDNVVRTVTRTRTCSQLAGQDPCEGTNTDFQTVTCDIDRCSGTWNTWGSWSTPTCPSCGDNVVRTVTRTRTCSQLAGQDPCEGTNTDFQTVTCDIDRCSGTWNTWGSWSTPTCPSCGDNVVRTVTRTRTCSQLAGQDPCEGTNTDFQTVTCDIERCLGTWNTWGSWSTPSCPSCGVNVVRTVTRTRTCSQLAGQDPCDGTNTDFQTVTCDIDSCIQATWQQWGTWSSPCPSPCSDNPQTLTERRTRGCDRQGAVSDCAGLSEESRDVVCTLCPVWRQWSDWTSSCPTGCSNVFINGVRTRSRICDTRGSTLTCSGSNLESLPDTCTFCPAQWSTWGSWTGPSCPDCGLPQTTRQTRVRNCNPFTGQPTCVGDSTEFRDQPCNIVNCRGTYGPWTQWSLPNCPDCGAPGIQRGVSRTRTCQKLMPTYDDCVGSDVDNKFVTCAIEQCDTGVWAPWNTWSNLCPSPCSDTPVNRLQSRNRVCNRATPTDRDCPGDSSQSQNVDCTVCRVGSWTEWTQWSPPADCPACGFNVFQDQSRSRQCITTGFESPCTGDRSQSRRFECQIPTCPAAPGPDNLGLCLNVRNISGVGYRYHPEDCDKYVQCYFNPNGEVTAIYRPCPFGHYWSQDTMRCDFSWRVNCPHERCNDTCVSTHNMEGSCRAYWSCEKGRSEAKCCPHFFRYVPGSGCQYDPLCQDPCPTGCSPRDACDKAPVWTDPQMFRVNVGLLGWMESKCINGSAFDLIDCGCSLKKPSTCKSEFDLNFDNPSDLTNAIGNWLTSESVKVEDGVAKFDGVGKLTADTKLSEAGVSCPFVLQFQYLRTGSGRTRQVMASSKDCTHGNTMVISQYNDSVVIELMSWFGPLMRLPISTKNLDPLDWKDFTLVYNGKLLTAMIRDSNYRVMAQFSAPKVLLGACGLHFGSDGSIMTAFEGQMDEIHLYKCDPGNLF